uniref:Uncharacterized protein n=1 Tax=Mastacembelus armatus TaxID=205130 RepID=A0A7N9ARP3_9TELE
TLQVQFISGLLKARFSLLARQGWPTPGLKDHCPACFLTIPVTSIDCHSRFDFLLGQLHALIKYLEEFLRLVVPR